MTHPKQGRRAAAELGVPLKQVFAAVLAAYASTSS